MISFIFSLDTLKSEHEEFFKSLEKVKDLSEGAVGAHVVSYLLKGENATVLRGVGRPLRSVSKVVVHPLVAEVQVLIAPVRGC